MKINIKKVFDLEKVEINTENLINHFKTITRHRHEVIKNCFKAGIGVQGLFHDLSKYTPTEFMAGVEYYQGTRSPNEGEREAIGYSTAWMHHKGRNKHHYEYWTDYNPETKLMSGVKMPTRYFVEMVCDRIAASKIYYGDAYTDSAPLEYFKKGKGRLVMHPDTAKELKKVLTMLSVKGEDYTFRYLRKKLAQSEDKTLVQKVWEWI